MLYGRAGTLLRSLLWATLAVAVLAMHHTPLIGGGHAPAHSQGEAVHMALPEAVTGPPARGSAAVVEARRGCCEAMTIQAAGDFGQDVPAGEHGENHDLLHLCLAVLAAIAGLAFVVFALGWRDSSGVAPRGWHRSGGGFERAPPVPTLRRLAVLCVLRQ